MAFWLFKSEPDEYSIDDLQAEPAGFGVWDGIRNYQARNFLRDEVAVGDGVLFYHSSCKHVGNAGTADVVKAGYPDPAQFDPDNRYFDPKATAEAPRWYCVDIRFRSRIEPLIPLAELRAIPTLEDMVLLNQGRLSIQPVQPAEWSLILALRS